MLYCHKKRKRKRSRGVCKGLQQKERQWREMLKIIANYFLWKSNPVIRKGSGEVNAEGQRKEKLLLPVLHSSSLICPFHTTCSHLTPPKKAQLLPLHITKVLTPSSILRFPKVTVYFNWLYSANKMNYYINLALTKDISIFYAWHVTKIPTLDNFVLSSLETCILVICGCLLNKNNIKSFLKQFFENWRCILTD